MQDLNPVDNYLHGSWEALGNAAPVLVALAQLCSERWVRRTTEWKPEATLAELPDESLAILFAARRRGTLEIRAVNSAFDAAARLLAVYVEVDEDRTIAFRNAANPAVTVRFLAGFRDLCNQGLIIHHIYRDFSLSPEALELAELVDGEKVQYLLDMATEFGLHD